MNVIEGSSLDLTVKGGLEYFTHEASGFVAGWNGTPDAILSVPSGTGMVVEHGHMHLRGTKALQFENRFFPSWAPPRGEWSEALDGRVDDKRDTTGTGGSERGYVDLDLWTYLRNPNYQDRMRAVQELMAWSVEQCRRPFSMVPWEYDEGDRWKASRRGPGTKVERYNRVDAAHASRTNGYALACLGHPLGEMVAYMEGRTILWDAWRTWKYVLNQPRKVAWLLEWGLRMTLLGVYPGALEDSEERSVDPRAFLTRLVQEIVDHWWDKYPKGHNKDGKRTDNKVAPQVVGEWPEHPEWQYQLFARYSWQRGLLLACACRVIAAAEGDGPVPIDSVLLDSFGEWARDLAEEVQIAYAGGNKWSYAYGLTDFGSNENAELVINRAHSDYFAKYGKEPAGWGAHNGHAIKDPSNYDYFFRYAYAYLFDEDHPVNQYDDVTRKDKLQYTGPWFALQEE